MRNFCQVTFLVATLTLSGIAMAASQQDNFATCPTADAKNFKAGDASKRQVYTTHLDGKPNLLLQTDMDNKAPAKRFDMMMLTPISPYFVSCWYNKGMFVVKTQKGNFYNTEKKCKLVGAKEGDVQTTSVASICSSRNVADCKLVCK
jgi:hypothetical protein